MWSFKIRSHDFRWTCFGKSIDNFPYIIENWTDFRFQKLLNEKSYNQSEARTPSRPENRHWMVSQSNKQVEWEFLEQGQKMFINCGLYQNSHQQIIISNVIFPAHYFLKIFWTDRILNFRISDFPKMKLGSIFAVVGES